MTDFKSLIACIYSIIIVHEFDKKKENAASSAASGIRIVNSRRKLRRIYSRCSILNICCVNSPTNSTRKPTERKDLFTNVY